jgi:Protein of unknown function (DUF3224)
MTLQASGTFLTAHYDMQPFHTVEGAPTLLHYKQNDTFSGDIQGEATNQNVVVMNADGSASFIGYQRIVGKLGNRSGSFILQHTGKTVGNITTTTWTVVPGSATDGLRGLKGNGGFTYDGGENVPYTFNYSFD